MNSVMVETVNVTAKEKVLLERCQGFLSRVAAMQVNKFSSCSLVRFRFICNVYILTLIWGKHKTNRLQTVA